MYKHKYQIEQIHKYSSSLTWRNNGEEESTLCWSPPTTKTTTSLKSQLYWFLVFYTACTGPQVLKHQENIYHCNLQDCRSKAKTDLAKGVSGCQVCYLHFTDWMFGIFDREVQILHAYMLTNIHGKYSWIFSDTAEAVCDTTPPPLLINLPTNPRCRNLQIPNLEILTMEMHKCSLWKIFTKADSRKLAQKLSFPASLVSFSFLQQSNAKIGLNFHEAL